MTSYFFLAVGLLLIFLEFFLPGAMIGIIGGVLLFTSIVFFIAEGHSALASLAYIVVIVLLVALLIKFAIDRIKATKSKQSIYSDDAQVGFVASHFDTAAIGKTGVVLSDLKPGGYILIDDKKQQALSVEGYISKGREVIVISGQEESLIVKLKESTAQSNDSQS